MQKKIKKPVERMDVEWGRISQRICAIIAPVMGDRGYTKTTLAASIEYPQSSLSDVFSPEEKGRRRRWSMPLLLAVCEQLGLDFADVISAAWKDSSTACLQLRLSSLPERSRERLQAIVQTAAPGDVSEEMKTMFYSLNMLEAVVPEYVKAYLKGAIEDKQVYEDLLDCQERANGNFWGKVKVRLGGTVLSHKVMKPAKEAKTQKVIELKETANEQKPE